jgi:hypothetical protein
MSEKNINVMMVLIAIVLMFAIAAQHFDRVELSVASLGLHVRAASTDTSSVNLAAIMQELKSLKS